MNEWTREERRELARRMAVFVAEMERERDASTDPDERAELDKEIVHLRRGLEKERRWLAGGE